MIGLQEITFQRCNKVPPPLLDINPLPLFLSLSLSSTKTLNPPIKPTYLYISQFNINYSNIYLHYKILPSVYTDSKRNETLSPCRLSLFSINNYETNVI